MTGQSPATPLPADSPRARPVLSRDENDAAKGVLILLIVLGHNTLAQAVWPDLWPFLYNFHVYGFLLLPFLRASHPLRGRFVVDRAVRYLVPFAVFFTLSTIAFSVTQQLAPTGDRLFVWARGLVIGSAWAVDASSGFRLFWFLPALFSLVVWRSAIRSGSPGTRRFLEGLAVAGFLFAGLLPGDWVRLLPLGLPIAAYALVPGLVFEALWRRVGRARLPWVAVISGVVFAGLSLLAFARGTSLVIARLDVYSALEPLSLVIHAAIPIAALLAVLAASPWLVRGRILPALGRCSLVVYLVHGLVYQGLLRLSGVVGSTAGPRATAAIVTFAVTVAVSWAIAAAIDRLEPLRRLVTPRSLDDFVGGWRMPGRSTAPPVTPDP